MSTIPPSEASGTQQTSSQTISKQVRPSGRITYVYLAVAIAAIGALSLTHMG